MWLDGHSELQRQRGEMITEVGGVKIYEIRADIVHSYCVCKILDGKKVIIKRLLVQKRDF